MLGLLRPLFTIKFAFATLIYLTSAAMFGGVWYWSRQSEHAHTDCETVVSLNQLGAGGNVSPHDKQIVKLTDFQLVGQPFQLTDDDSQCEFSLLAGSEVDVSDLRQLDPKTLILARCWWKEDRQEAQLASRLALERGYDWYISLADRVAADDSSRGDWFQNEPQMQEVNDALQQQFPQLDASHLPVVFVDTPIEPWFEWIFGGLVGIYSIHFVYQIFSAYRDHYRNLRWLAKVDEDRSDKYRQSRNAMRLVGTTEWMGDFVEPVRLVDPVYDVQPTRKIQEPVRFSRSRMFATSLLFALASGCVLGSSSHIHILPEWLGDWGGMLVLFPIAVGIGALGEKIISRRVEQEPDREIKSGHFASRFTKAGFYQYHAQVLTELGFECLGMYSYKQCARSIYLSRNGNLLVEVGVEGAKPYFTLETVTNGGKFLETHSLATPQHEKRDVNMRFQRRSASHEDIVQALEEHDRLVAEFTYNGSAKEALFTKERFERFLRWGAESNAS